MAKSKQSAEIEIEIEGEPYLWWLHRRPQGSSVPAERRGMAIGARHREGRREVVMEFPPGPHTRIGAPQLQISQIPRRLVEAAITSALAAGWEPLSRGKTVEIVVDAEGR